MKATLSLPLVLTALMFLGGLVSACAKSNRKQAAQPAVEATAAELAADDAPEAHDKAHNKDAANDEEEVAATQYLGEQQQGTPAPSPRKKITSSSQTLDKAAPVEQAKAAEKEALAGSRAIRLRPSDSQNALRSEMDALNGFLSPEQLSCGGARPHLSAICAIADRLCGENQEPLHPEKDCKAATQSCKLAQKRFQQKCPE